MLLLKLHYIHLYTRVGRIKLLNFVVNGGKNELSVLGRDSGVPAQIVDRKISYIPAADILRYKELRIVR